MVIRHRTNARLVLQFIAVMAIASCKEPAQSLGTSPFGMNRLQLTGIVVDSAGSPLDGFYVAGASRPIASPEFMSGSYTTTGIDGRYSLELSHFADNTISDSAAVALSAQSQRASDHNPDGTRRSVRREFLTRFARPDTRVDTLVVNFVVPFKR